MLPCYVCNAGGALGGICEKRENPVRILSEVLLESATFEQKSLHILSVMCVCIFCGFSEVYLTATSFILKKTISVLIQFEFNCLPNALIFHFAPPWISIPSLLSLSHQILSMSPQQIELLFTNTSERQLISSPDGGPVPCLKCIFFHLHLCASKYTIMSLNTVNICLQSLFTNKPNSTINCNSS